MRTYDWADALAQTLARLADSDERSVLAHLRRGLNLPLDYTLGRVGWLFDRVPSWGLADAVLAAGLFAWAKGKCAHEAGVDFGTAFAAGLTQDEKTRREKRFVDLVDAAGDDLPAKLRQAVTLLANGGVGLDWALLIRHLRNWGHPDRWVQRAWARGFWALPDRKEPATETAST